MSNKQLILPSFLDINEFLCPKKKISFETAIRNHIKALKSTDIPYDIHYANKLYEYLYVINHKKIMPIEKDISQLIEHLRIWKQKNHYKFSIEIKRRRKSYKKFNEKIQLFIATQLNTNDEAIRQKYSLTRIGDLIGIRLKLVFDEKDTHSDISMCYIVLNEINNFFSGKRGYLPMNAEPLIDLGFIPEKYPNTVIPTEEEAIIPDGLKGNVKDYYRTPKKHSYQSLHVVFWSPKYGIPIEIQIRTMATDVRIEYQNCMHDKHDENRYPNKITLDYPNINILGYQYVKKSNATGDIEYIVDDIVGIEKSIDPFNLIY